MEGWIVDPELRQLRLKPKFLLTERTTDEWGVLRDRQNLYFLLL